MAYVSTLSSGTQHDNWFRRDRNSKPDADNCMETMVLVEIGRDSVLPIRYQLMVYLQPSDEGTEYAFAIISLNNQTKKREVMFDARVANQIIPKSFRAQIIRTLHEVTRRMIDVFKPESFYMVTYKPVSDPKALKKYVDLSRLFTSLGYHCSQTEPTLGSYHWQMTHMG